MPISPGGLVLSVNDQRRALGGAECGAFEGEDDVFAAELDMPTQVINLIRCRDRCRGDLTAVSVVDALKLEPGATVLVAVVTAGGVTIAGGPRLSSLDAFCLDSDEAVTVSGKGALRVARITDRR